MTKLFTPTEAAIGAWVGDQSFSRGQSYYRQHAITNPRRQGDTLKAQCFGSAPQPYRVEVTLEKNQIIGDYCSCPIGGHCKHVAALLLTWLHDAEEFVTVEELNAVLGKRSKEELIALIVRMISRYPDLETLLEITLPGAAQTGKMLDPKLIQRQVNQVFHGWDYEYGAGLAAAGQLAEIRALGDQYAATGEWRNAVVVYHTVAQGVLDHYEYDDEGELGEVADECVSGLGEALAAVTDPALREVILRYLFEIYHWDLKSGGYGVGDETPGLLVERTTPAEKEMLAQLTRSAMPTGNDWSAGWQRQALGAMLLELEADTLDDETYLRICRETGLTYDLVDRLLTLNHIEETLAIVQDAGDYELLTMEPLFTQHDQFELFARLIAGRAPATQDARIKRWLKQHIEKQGDLDQALSLAQELFWLYPSLEEYSHPSPITLLHTNHPHAEGEQHARLSQKRHPKRDCRPAAARRRRRSQGAHGRWQRHRRRRHLRLCPGHRRPTDVRHRRLRLFEPPFGQR